MEICTLDALLEIYTLDEVVALDTKLGDWKEIFYQGVCIWYG